MNDAGKEFIDHVKHMGWRGHDMRDAVHETFHAFYADMVDMSDRLAISKKLVWLFNDGPSGLWMHEIHARLIEREMCGLFQTTYEGTLKDWLTVSVLEATRTEMPFVDINRTMKMADRVDPSVLRNYSNELIAWVNDR